MANVKLFPTDKRVESGEVIKMVQEWLGGRYKYLPAEPTKSFILNTYYKVDLREYWLYAREIGTQDTPIGGVVLLHGDDLIKDNGRIIQAMVVRTGADGLIGFEEFMNAGFPQREYYDQLGLYAPDRAERVAPLHTCELLTRLGIFGSKHCEYCGKTA